jgi:hypothetical protein
MALAPEVDLKAAAAHFANASAARAWYDFPSRLAPTFGADNSKNKI